MPNKVKADLHVHSYYSSDSLITPQDLVHYSNSQGLNAVAVTDHNQIKGSWKIAKETDFLVIPGMEVSSAHGHIVALNVCELIPRGLSAEETVDNIHEAGGIAIAVHPYAWMKGSLTDHVQEAKFDAVETVNANAFPYGRCKRKAEEIAHKLQLPRVGGTDAHYGPTIGYGYTVIDCEPSVESITRAIVDGKCQAFGRPIPALLTLERQIQLIFKRQSKKFPLS